MRGRDALATAGGTPARLCRSHEICQQTICSRIKTGIFFGDGEAGEDVGFEIDVGRGAGNLAHRRSRKDLFRRDACLYAIANALSAADQLEGPAVAAGVAQGLRREVADTVAGDVFELHGHIHQDSDQGGGFHGGVPAVDVVSGIGFSDA